jgi:hypothetical protein
MLVTKTSPIGIDWHIAQLQSYLHDGLVKRWKVQQSDYIAYGRCYRNKVNEGYVAENYEGGGTYKEVYWESGQTVMSFFGISGNITHKAPKSEANVHLVYFADLSKLKPSITHRADEEVRQDVITLLGYSKFSFVYQGMDFGIENVLREYPGSRRDDRLKYVDMHPVHAFRINLKILFDPNKIC